MQRIKVGCQIEFIFRMVLLILYEVCLAQTQPLVTAVRRIRIKLPLQCSMTVAKIGT